MGKIAEKIKSYPTSFGVLIGLVIVAVIFTIETWFPRLGNAWETHNSLVRTISFTLALFIVWITHLWRWRRRRAFWIALISFFAIHITGIFLYTNYIHDPTLRQWIALMIVESFLLRHR